MGANYLGGVRSICIGCCVKAGVILLGPETCFTKQYRQATIFDRIRQEYVQETGQSLILSTGSALE